MAGQSPEDKVQELSGTFAAQKLSSSSTGAQSKGSANETEETRVL